MIPLKMKVAHPNDLMRKSIPHTWFYFEYTFCTFSLQEKSHIFVHGKVVRGGLHDQTS